MRIVQPEDSWFVLRPCRVGRLCLRRLALRCGYRICEICSELGCSERYLYEVFLRDTGQTPKKWMRWERMEVAARQLVGGSPPEEVAKHLGFSSAGSFRREFLAVHRMPPLDFQRERKREHQEESPEHVIGK